MKVLILQLAEQRIREEIDAAGVNETGGVLLGWQRTDLQVTVVAAATGPGERSILRPTRLVLDTQNLQREIDEAFTASSGDHNFLGDWHLHHEAKPRASRRDLLSLAELAAERGLGIGNALLLIVGRGKAGQLTWHAWYGADAVVADVQLQSE